MTTLELYRKHKKGEIGRDRFLYEVRRDNNLPWVTNITSYDDAVKILKNKGIIREELTAEDIFPKAAEYYKELVSNGTSEKAAIKAALDEFNILYIDFNIKKFIAYLKKENIIIKESVQTDPIVDSVNPYALKRAVHKLLDKEKVLTNDSYVEALNKAAKKLTTPQAVKQEMFANADAVAKADAKLQTQEVKKANHKDKHNDMKKVKGQQTPKATSAPTKENKKTKKPKGVEVMKDKGVEGSEKIIKEISSYIKKKLTENSSYHDYHEGMQVETKYGTAIVKEINGGILTCETADGKLYDVQMNHAKHFTEKAKEQPKQEDIDVRNIGGHEAGMQLADKLIDAIEMYNALDPEQKQAEIERLKTDIPAELKAKFDELMDALHDESNYPAQEEDPNLKEYFSSDFVGNWSTITVSLRDAARAIELFRDASFDNYLQTKVIEMDGTNSYIVKDPDVAVDLYDLFNENGIEMISAHFPEKEDDELYEARDINDPALVSSRARIDAFKNRPSDEEVEIAGDRDTLLFQAIKDLKAEYRQFKIEDEQSSSTGGDASSQYYGGILQAIKDKIAELRLLHDLDAKQLAQLSDEEFENALASREEIDAAIIANEDDIEEVSYAGKGSITAFKKDPKYAALSGPTRVDMEKKLDAGGSVEL